MGKVVGGAGAELPLTGTDPGIPLGYPGILSLSPSDPAKQTFTITGFDFFLILGGWRHRLAENTVSFPFWSPLCSAAIV